MQILKSYISNVSKNISKEYRVDLKKMMIHEWWSSVRVYPMHFILDSWSDNIFSMLSIYILWLIQVESD